MTITELQALVRRCHDQHFGKTELRERLRDLANEVAELTHHRDPKNLVEEAGDVGWSLLQLCNEMGLELDALVPEVVWDYLVLDRTGPRPAARRDPRVTWCNDRNRNPHRFGEGTLTCRPW